MDGGFDKGGWGHVGCLLLLLLACFRWAVSGLETIWDLSFLFLEGGILGVGDGTYDHFLFVLRGPAPLTRVLP